MTDFGGPEIGLRVAQYRKLNGWSMADLERKTAALGSAEEPFIRRDVIANIETGRKKDITVRQLMSLAEALGVPVVALLVSVDRPFSRIMIGGWNRTVDSLRHVLAGDRLWMGPSEATPAGMRAARLVAAVEPLERLRSGIKQSLDSLARDGVPVDVLLDLPDARPTTVAVDQYGDRIRELSSSMSAYAQLREGFEQLGGEIPFDTPWNEWNRERYGAPADSAE